MIRVSLAIVLSFISTAAVAVECRTGPARDGKHWAWRNVDGKPCWYAGQPGVSKRGLVWAGTQRPDSSSQPEGVPARPQTNGLAAEPGAKPSLWRQPDEELLLESVWPPLPSQPTFDERFNGIRQQGPIR
jgi:hypothetical protein